MPALVAPPEPIESGARKAAKPQTPILGAPADSPAAEPRIRRVLTTRSVHQTLPGISPHWRAKIRTAYRQMRGAFGPLNQDRRALLAEAIFQIENDLEHRRPQHPQVNTMNAARNALYDDLGWNEETEPGRACPGYPYRYP